MKSIALASVVTFPLFNEFCILKYSFELFHGNKFLWYIRCDQETKKLMRQWSNVRCTVFAAPSTRQAVGENEFQRVAAQKMNAIEDAWANKDIEAVAFLDADLIITTAFIEPVASSHVDLVLTSNHLPYRDQQLAPFHGYFNSGFILTKTPEFHKQWREAFISQPWLLSDQVCLNDVVRKFKIRLLNSSANIGFWHSPGSWSFEFLKIPADCQFLHVHLFNNLEAHRGWVDRTFALHCLLFMVSSPVTKHRKLYNRIMTLDKSGWFAASISLTDIERFTS